MLSANNLNTGRIPVIFTLDLLHLAKCQKFTASVVLNYWQIHFFIIKWIGNHGFPAQLMSPLLFRRIKQPTDWDLSGLYPDPTWKMSGSRQVTWMRVIRSLPAKPASPGQQPMKMENWKCVIIMLLSKVKFVRMITAIVILFQLDAPFIIYRVYLVEQTVHWGLAKFNKFLMEMEKYLT